MASPAVSSSSSGDTPSEIPSTPEEELEKQRMALLLHKTDPPKRDPKKVIKEFFDNAYQTFTTFADINLLVHNIERLTYLSNKYRSNFCSVFCKYVDLLKILLSWTNYSLTDHEISEPLDAALSDVFSGINQLLYSYTKHDLEEIRKNFCGVYTIEYILDTSSKFLNQLQSSSAATVTARRTLPKALNVLFIIGSYAHDFLDLDMLFRHIILIAVRLSSLNVPVEDYPEWVQLLTRLHFCMDAYQWIEQQNLPKLEELQELACSLVEFCLADGYSQENYPNTNGFCLFSHYLVKRSFKKITLKFNENTSQEPIKRHNLFQFFQKEITEVMVNFAIRVSHPQPIEVLLHGMSLFNIHKLVKELLRWSLPPFLVRRNDQTEALLRGIMTFTGQPLKTAFENNFNDILVYIFFDCAHMGDPVRLTYDVFAFGTRVGGENLFQLFDNISLTGRFVDDCLKLYCVNRNRTFLAVSFISKMNPIVHLDPEQPESFLKVPVDFNPHSSNFRSEMEFRFANYIHNVDSRVMCNQDTPEDKLHLIDSYAQLMKFVGESFIKKFKMEIYFTVRALFDYFSKDYLNRLNYVGKILEELICGTETYFVQAELPAICCLLVPFAKVIPRQSVKVLEKIFYRHKFPKQVYFQLHFMSCAPSFSSIYELIRKQTGIGCYDDQLPVPDLSEDLNQFVDFIQGDTFSARCREILFILDQVNYNNNKVQELALGKLYELFSLNVDIYNQILSAKQQELKIYEDLSEIPLDLLPDGHDGPSQYVPEMYELLADITTVGKFFQTLIAQLLKCLKFVSRERASMIANCLGLLGAIDPKFLNIDKPCLSEVYKIDSNNRAVSQSSQVEHHEVSETMYSIDFCNQRPFRHQTREFKQIILESLMKIIRSAVTQVDFTYASLGIQELMKLFTTASPNMIIDNDLLQNGSGESVNDDDLENLIIKLYAKEIQSSATAQKEMMDNLAQVMAREKIECIRKNYDLSRELYDYLTKVEANAGVYHRKRAFSRHPITMDLFFESISPTMTYFAFLESFLKMLYHCFIFKQSSKSDVADFAASKASQRLDFHHIVFSQYNTQYQSSQSYTQEFKEIIEKLKTIKSPQLVFEVCYKTIFSDPKLAHIIFPSLLILSLSYADSKTIEKFSTHFRSMIQNKFLLNPQYFLFELGPQVAELICFLYDFLVDFDKSRKKAHFFMVRSLVLRNRVNRFDSEYSSVSTLLKDIELLDMAKLAFASGSHHKALSYIEKKFADKLEKKLSDAALDAFRQENLEFIMRIYSEMGDEDSVKGCRLIANTHMPTLESMLSTAFVERNSLEALMISAQLLRNDNRTNHESGKQSTMSDFFVQDKYFAMMQELHLNPSLCASRLISDLSSRSQSSKSELPTLWSSKAPMYMIDATWKLNQWEEMDTVANAFHSFGGSFNSELSKLEQDRSSQSKKKDSITFGADTGMSEAVVPSIGTVLHSLKKEEALFVFQSKLGDIRSNVLGHLKAALLSNQSSAYQRAYYSSIIPLHLIHDVQQFSQTIYEKLIQNHSAFQSEQSSAEDIFQCFTKLKAGWEARNRFVPLIAVDHSNTINQIIDVQRSLVKILQQHSMRISPNNSDLYAIELFRYWAKGLATEIKCGNLDRAYANMLEATQLMTDLLRNKEQSLLDFLSSDERADFVLDSAKVHWCRRDERAALKVIKNELVKNYSKLEQVCFMETGKRYLSSSCDTEKSEISSAIGLNVETIASRFITSDSLLSTSGSKRFNSLQSHSEELARVNRETQRNPNVYRTFGRLQLQYARYAEECRHFSTNSLFAVYKAVKIACPNWEEGFFSSGEFMSNLAKEYERSMVTKIGSETKCVMCKPEEILDCRHRIIMAYCESLKYGNQFLPISLPKLLNTWVELGYEEREFLSNNPSPFLYNIVHSGVPNRLKEHYKRAIELSTEHIVGLTRVANNAIFLYAVDTLITHLMHPNNDIARCIKNILTALCVDFPHHMAWHLSRSSTQNNRRGFVVKEILNKAASQEKTTGIDLVKFNFSFRNFAGHLNELSRFKPTKSQNSKPNDASINYEFSLRRAVPALAITMESASFKFVMPFNKLLMPSLLNLERLKSTKDFNFFFSGFFIEKFKDQVQTMKSLQLPKKITCVCQDGVNRILLCKSSDDLRKDRCFLNFANLFNQAYGGEIPRVDSMRRNAEELQIDNLTEEKIIAKRRLNPLKVQTYFACPLSDSYGVIEWIPGLTPMKVIVEEQYIRTRLSKLCYYTARNNFTAHIVRHNSKPNKEKRIEIYLKSLPSFKPSVLHLWFQTQFADAYSWAMAKQNFTRTSAAYSVLGYILGLGDRHSENLLFDPATGEMVQVDFNCLFNRGEDFIVPECVPFRMTHNMETAMGVIGYEGQFRHTAEDVLLVLRQYRKLFAKYVTQFIYDPLAEWIENHTRNDQAEKSIFCVEARLSGFVSRTKANLYRGRQVSVIGQIDHIIKEAANPNNLGAMYQGWAAYI